MADASLAQRCASRTHRQHRGSTETGSAALRTLLGDEVKRVRVLKGAEAPGIPAWSGEPSSGLTLASWAGTPAVHPRPRRTSAHLLEGSNPWTPSPPRPAPGLPIPR